jgi:hypothetical protein
LEKQTVWQAWSDSARPSWQTAACVAAWVAIERNGMAPDATRLQRAISEWIEPQSGAVAAEALTNVDDLRLASVDLGVRLGFALARTWPDGLHGIDGWPLEALRFLCAS